MFGLLDSRGGAGSWWTSSLRTPRSMPIAGIASSNPLRYQPLSRGPGGFRRGVGRDLGSSMCWTVGNWWAAWPWNPSGFEGSNWFASLGMYWPPIIVTCSPAPGMRRLLCRLFPTGSPVLVSVAFASKALPLARRCWTPSRRVTQQPYLIGHPGNVCQRISRVTLPPAAECSARIFPVTVVKPSIKVCVITWWQPATPSLASPRCAACTPYRLVRSPAFYLTSTCSRGQRRGGSKRARCYCTPWSTVTGLWQWKWFSRSLAGSAPTKAGATLQIHGLPGSARR